MIHLKKAVIFDLDGTLIDTSKDIAIACNKALKSEGLQIFPEEKFKSIVGWGLKRTMYLSSPDECQKDEKMMMILHKKQLEFYRENPCKKTRIYPGIAELLKTLNKNNIPIAIWTNKEEDIANYLVKVLLPTINFVTLLGSHKTRPLKPDATASSILIKKLGLSRNEILYVGDSDVDMKTALNSSFYPLGVTWGYRTREVLINAGAKKIVNNPEEISSLFS